MRDKGENVMKRFDIPELKVTYFDTYETMTDPAYPYVPESVNSIFETNEQKVQVGSINFETLK